MIDGFDVGGLHFFRGALPHGGDPGFVLDEDGVSGWLDGVALKREKSERPGKPGSYDLPGVPGDRLVTLSGYAIAGTERELMQLARRFSGHLARGESVKVTGTFAGDSIWGMARREGAPQFRPIAEEGGSTTARFQLQLWFADPFLYGKQHAFAQNEEISHYGNTDAYTWHRVQAGVPGTSFPNGYTLTGPYGARYQVTRALNAGEQHEIFMADGSLRIGGKRVYGGVGITELWTIPPGAAMYIKYSEPLLVYHFIRDTYL